jgi:hypothetical protein
MLNPYELERYARICAKRAKLRVKFEPGVTPSTDGETIFLPPPNFLTMTEEQAIDIKHFVAHETSHVLHTDFDPAKAGKMVFGSDSLLGLIMNLIEDHRIDYINGREFAGDLENGISFATRFIPQFAVRFHKLGNRAETAATLFCWDLLARDYPCAGDAEATLKPLSNQDKLKKLMGYTPQLLKLRQILPKEKGTQASWELAVEIFEKVYGGDAKKELQRATQGQQSKQGGEGQAGEGEAGSELSDGSGDSEARGTGKGDKPGEGEGIATVKWEDAGGNPMNVNPNTSRRGMHIDWTRYKAGYGGPYQSAALYDHLVVDFIGGDVPSRFNGRSTVCLPDASTSDAFAQQVRLNLQIRARSKYEYGLKSGKLNPRALYRMGIDTPGQPVARVFKRKHVSDVLDAAVSVLVDGSGSMGGSKYEHAAKSALLLNEAIGNVLSVPLEIISFTEDTAGNSHPFRPIEFIHRKHDTRVLPEQQLLASFETAGAYKYNNADGDSVLWTFDRLAKRFEKKKLLVVLSDGGPASRRPGDHMGYCQKVIQHIERGGFVDIVGIGIMDNNVSLLYKKHYVIHNAAELETALLTLIDRYLV